MPGYSSPPPDFSTSIDRLIHSAVRSPMHAFKVHYLDIWQSAARQYEKRDASVGKLQPLRRSLSSGHWSSNSYPVSPYPISHSIRFQASSKVISIKTHERAFRHGIVLYRFFAPKSSVTRAMANKSCNVSLDRDFGPGVQCTQFNFMLLFEQSIFGIGISAVLLILSLLRVKRLLRAPVKTSAHPIYIIKMANV